MAKYNYEQTRCDYLTPKELFRTALSVFGHNRDYFDLDTCCTQETIPAKEYYKYGEKDGLKEEWRNFNWCNPPYNQCEKWVKKAYEEQQKGKSTAMLIPVRTETKYWHEYILYNSSVTILWLRKGYSFVEPDTHKPMGIFKNALALVYFIGV